MPDGNGLFQQPRKRGGERSHPLARLLFPLTPLLALLLLAPALGDEPAAPSAVGPLLRILQNSQLPDDRKLRIVEVVCQRGNEHDLAFVFQQCVADDGFAPAVRAAALRGLAEAAQTRRVRPRGSLDALASLLAADLPAEQRQVVAELAGRWQVRALRESLAQLVAARGTSAALRSVAVEALVALGDDASRQAVIRLTDPAQPIAVRFLGVAAVARFDHQQAARLAAQVLADAQDRDDPTVLIDAFLKQQGGADALAQALADAPLPKDTARMCLRAVYAAGRSDAALVEQLSRSAGVSATVKPLSKPQLAELIGQVRKQGDAARGEQVFRRADLSCMKCHSVSKAGGAVGPDLSSVGANSPVDYLVASVMLPDSAKKEAFLTRVIRTDDGRRFQGIVVDRDDRRVVLKEASGQEVVIPADSIEAEKEGESLMPQGLVNLMTRAEFIDLIRFLSELGKPGDYAVRTSPSVQRWRVLTSVSDELAAGVPNVEVFGDQVLAAPPEDWAPAYAMVAGQLPLDELARYGPVLYLQGEIDVTVVGRVGVRLQPHAVDHWWIDDLSLAGQSEAVAELPRGRHTLTVRIDRTGDAPATLRAECYKPPGSAAEFTVVGGP